MLKSFLVIVMLTVCYPTLSATNNILVFGDSLSAAYNLPTEKGWVALLETELKNRNLSFSVSNASISGETSSGGLTRFKAQLLKTKPSIVILELGANDGLRGFDLKTTRSNLLTMITMSHETQATVILAGIHIPPNYGRTYTQKFDQIYTDLSKLEKVVLIPFILEDVATNSELMLNDGLHPNEKGQIAVLGNVLKYLLPILKTNN